MAKILSIQHVALTVPSARLEEARRFYSDVLGLEERGPDGDALEAQHL